jgi:phospholipid-transporting ATPase
MQGPSPDEVALVEGARKLGFEVIARTQNGLQLRLLGTEATFEILNVLEYSSARARMSVIARAPDGTIRLFCKGSDMRVLGIVRKDTPKSLMDATDNNLHNFATKVRCPACIPPFYVSFAATFGLETCTYWYYYCYHYCYCYYHFYNCYCSNIT